MKKLLLLFLPLMFLSGCLIDNPEPAVWEDVCVDEGDHLYLPAVLRTGVDDLPYKWEFTSNSFYDVGPVDNQDWNKLTGISFKLFTSTECSAMFGWRYNLSTGLFEISPYYHVGSDRFNVDTPGLDGQPIWNGEPISVATDEIFETYVNVDRGQSSTVVTLTLVSDAGSSSYSYVMDDRVSGVLREINPWFGGNRTAPWPLCMRRCLIQ